MSSCLLLTFGSQTNAKSYHNELLIRLSCGEFVLQIYPVFIRIFDVQLCVAFLFAFSISIDIIIKPFTRTEAIEKQIQDNYFKHVTSQDRLKNCLWHKK